MCTYYFLVPYQNYLKYYLLHKCKMSLEEGFVLSTVEWVGSSLEEIIPGVCF